MNQDRLLTVGILIFDDVEVLDFCGPFEVFSVARPAGKYGDEFKLFNVVTIAEEDRIITCRGGLLVKPHATTENHPPLDILVVPGGQGTRRERHNQRLLDWIARQDQHTNLTTSVCTGAFLLEDVSSFCTDVIQYRTSGSSLSNMMPASAINVASATDKSLCNVLSFR